MKVKIEGEQLVFFALGVVSPIYFLLISGTQIIFFALLITMGFVAIKRGLFKIKIVKDKVFTWICIISFFSMVSGILFNNNPNRWKWQAVVFFLYNTVIFIFYFISAEFTDEDIRSFFQGFKLCAIIQVVYGYMQFFFYRIWKIDLNEAIFGNMLHLDRPLSHYNYDTLVPSGFSWHPSTYAPLLVILYCMSEGNIVVKCLAVGIAVLAQNSTCILGISCCLLFDFFKIISKSKKKLTKKKIIIGAVVLIVTFILVFRTNLIDSINKEVGRVIRRIFTESNVNFDMSSYYHKRYYWGLFEIANKSNIVQLLFGYGEGCSGYPFVKLYSQYISNPPWSVESEVVNRLINKGIVGFTLTYMWLFRILKKGIRINTNFLICMIALLVESITYNIAFFWVFVIEIMMQISLKRRIDIWKNVADKNKIKKKV